MSCPARGVSPAAAEALRQRGVGALRGTTPAPARPALGLSLDRTRVVDVRAWASARGLACEARQRPSSVVTCTNVPLTAVWPGRIAGSIDELAFAFAPDGRLVAVDSLRRALSGAAASRCSTSWRASWRRRWVRTASASATARRPTSTRRRCARPACATASATTSRR